MNHLKDFRNEQSNLLQKRLNLIKKANQSRTNDALSSEKDEELLQSLIKNKTFLVVPIMNSKEEITHIYTIGCWYYWGIPEIVIKFKNPFIVKVNFIHTIISMIHDCLFSLYSEKIMTNDPLKINKIEFEDEHLNITDLNIEIELCRVSDDKYLELNTGYMLWFYSFWAEAEVDESNEPIMYPVYTLELSQNGIDEFIDGLVNNLMTKMESVKLSDTEDDDSVVDSSVGDESDD